MKSLRFQMAGPSGIVANSAQRAAPGLLRVGLILTLLALAVGFGLVRPVHAILPTIYTVTNTNDSGAGSLRQAIIDANTNVGFTDTINFDIADSLQTISPTSALPAITDTVTIDGTPPAGKPNQRIELTGTSAGSGANGLRFTTATGSTVKNLIINGFSLGDGIQLESGGHTIQGNIIGLDDDGATILGNQYGIRIFSTNNVIGGTTASERNIISGNGAGVAFPFGASTSGNVVQGNYIGTDSTGTLARGNSAAGVAVASAGVIRIGGDGGGAGNVISANTSNGVWIASESSDGMLVQGNLIGLNAAGTAALGNNVGVRIESGADNTEIGGDTAGKRNVISGNGAVGIFITGSSTTGNMVRGNYIGTNVAGTAAIANFNHGVQINAPGNTIGGDTGTDEDFRNVISGNGSSGVVINGGPVPAANSNLVQGNYIGLNAVGTGDLGNGSEGVWILAGAAAADANEIGGDTPGKRNVISGNNSNGIRIQGATGNLVRGNYIGLSAAGTASVANTFDGVKIISSPGNVVGGDTAIDADFRNLISGNGDNGVEINGETADGNLVQGNHIGLSASGTALGNNGHGVFVNNGADGSEIGGDTAGERNVISGNNGAGISIGDSGTTGNLVRGNHIGTNAAGTAGLSNNGYGVEVMQAPDNTIGGDTDTDVDFRNVIAANAAGGIRIFGDASDGNLVQGNYIGLSATGTALGNNGEGVSINNGADDNEVGGDTSGKRNIISGNNSGVLIADPTTTGNKVQGNYIGTDPTGLAAFAQGIGVDIEDAPGNTIGGDTGLDADFRNLISGNSYAINISGESSDGNLVQGNYIGTDITGTAIIGNGNDGVFVGNGADNNEVGGNTAGKRNLISGNGTNGVFIGSTSTSSGNLVQGNYIGTDATGTTGLGNSLAGVRIFSSTGNTIGGLAAGQGNTIAFNTAGVIVVSGTGNAILSNSIFSNTNLGIDLGLLGVTPNDRGDKDSGPNSLQNFPVLTSVNASSTHVAGTLNSVANTTFTLQFFDNPACDSSGFGEGKTFLGETAVTTDNRGNADFAATFGTTAAGFVTATATNAATGDTSEFSQCLQVNTGGDNDVGIAGGGFSTSGRADAGSTKDIKIKIKNFGSHAEDSVPYAVTSGGGPGRTYSAACSGDAASLSPDGDLDPGEVVTITGCTVTYDGGAGEYTHTLTVTHPVVADDNPANNTDSKTTTVVL